MPHRRIVRVPYRVVPSPGRARKSPCEDAPQLIIDWLIAIKFSLTTFFIIGGSYINLIWNVLNIPYSWNPNTSISLSLDFFQFKIESNPFKPIHFDTWQIGELVIWYDQKRTKVVDRLFKAEEKRILTFSMTNLAGPMHTGNDDNFSVLNMRFHYSTASSIPPSHFLVSPHLHQFIQTVQCNNVKLSEQKPKPKPIEYKEKAYEIINIISFLSLWIPPSHFSISPYSHQPI